MKRDQGPICDDVECRRLREAPDVQAAPRVTGHLSLLVDVHQHFLCPEYVKAVGEAAISTPSPTGRAPEWSADGALALMDRLQIRIGFLSISAPGIVLSEERDAEHVARGCNEFAADVCKTHSGRFGMFATLPMPHLASAGKEAAFALDHLNADGIAMMTNYGGRYLGDPAFQGLFDLLNERQAVVFVHPTASGNPLSHPAEVASTLDFPFDSARAIISLLYSRAFVRWPNIRFIFTHAGGVMPFLADRITRAAALTPALQVPNAIDVFGALKGVWFDTTSSSHSAAFECVRRTVPSDRLLFGSDFPFIAEETIARVVKDLQFLDLSEDERCKLYSENASQIFPRLRVPLSSIMQTS